MSLTTLLLLSVIQFGPTTPHLANALKGDYVEARTASVFCGACHYNGEYMSSGREAVMAWNITSGSWNGVGLSNIRVMASVASDANLDDADLHRSQIVIDNAATDAQAKAVVAALEANCGTSLGQVLSVRRGTVSFVHRSGHYLVSSPQFAVLKVDQTPNGFCCSQPYDVWYTPLTHLKGESLGYTVDAAYKAGTLSDNWERHCENSSFYGAFSF
jgi:Protein of unknown function (DUF1326)